MQDINIFNEKSIQLYLKAFYLVLNDELFEQKKNKFEIEDFILLLGECSFHNNMMIIVIFIFMNIIMENFQIFNLDKGEININEFTLDKLTLKFIENLNKFKAFNVISSLQIINSLIKLSVRIS